MQQIELGKEIVFNPKAYEKHTVENNWKIQIKTPTVFTVNNKPLIVYGKFPNSTEIEVLRNHLKNLHFATSTRTAGLLSTSRTFGSMPRVVIRRDFCTTASMQTENPKAHDSLIRWGEKMANLYKEYFPEIYQKQKKIVESEILPEWIMPNTPFTSGITNKNNSLKYHYDNGNYPDVLSCMLVFKNSIQGGELCVPAFDLAIDICDRGYLIFDGQSILHGVAPIKPLNKTGYRYSVVYYALKAMNKCLSIKEEIERIRDVKAVRERKRLDANRDS